MLKKIHGNLNHSDIARFLNIIKKNTNLPYTRTLSCQISKECEICNRGKNMAQKYGVLEY